MTCYLVELKFEKSKQIKNDTQSVSGKNDLPNLLFDHISVSIL